MKSARPYFLATLWRWRYAVVAYLVLLGFSTGARIQAGRHARTGPDHAILKVKAVQRGTLLDETVQVAFKDLRPAGRGDAPVVVLFHGSPSRSFDLEPLARRLAARYRVILPDLPGFGASQRDVPDYSFDAYAIYARQIMDRLGIERAHAVAYSLGGGAALALAHREPQRVASLTLVSSIGAQEFELLGNYELNHALHGVQLGLLWTASRLLPHMGWLDTMMLNVPYARSFYDSDQRPLRRYLERYEGPLQMVHGRRDFLVSLAAAEEHHRITPQSELHVFDGGHIAALQDSEELAARVGDFVDRVERGVAVTRRDAAPERVAAAQRPFDPSVVPKAMGVALLILVTLIALATLISEDLACIGAGLMAANGILSYASAAFAAFLGIFVGDLLLFAAGKYIGRPALSHRPFRWFFNEDDLRNSTRWFSEKGPAAILVSRFIPGSRLPTYFAAGMLHESVWKFVGFFFIAGAVWAPLLVWIAMRVGGPLLAWIEEYRALTLWTAVVAVILIWAVVELVVPLFSFRGRRLLLSRWRRRTRWEFWPPWVFYPPVVAWVAWLGLKHRGLTVFTAANPAIPDGGFLGESKYAILKGLRGAGDKVARSALVPGGMRLELKLATVRDFLAAHGLAYPIVAKPDMGQRGVGVAVLRSEADVERYFAVARPDIVVQEFAPGFEFGFFYYRYPDRQRGGIFSVTEKRFPTVTGDGRSTLEQLVLRDDRAVCMAPFYLRKLQDRLSTVPADGERVQLVEIGNHCRGTVFYDGSWMLTPALEAELERISRTFDGFYFGRYDIRAPSLDDLREGRNFKIIELNGVTSEATHIYQPGSSLIAAYKTLARQWKIAFAIGAWNRRHGVTVTPVRKLVRALLDFEPAPEA
jgi:pimeloyl-ACP methyl ester carboxylesterase/membrane protein DedA with SNARE-associated domain